MSDERAKRLAQLRQAYESGILDDDTYRAAVAALGVQTEIQAEVEGPGAIAQVGGVAAGAGGVAVGRDIVGNIYFGPPPQNSAEALRIYRQVLISACRHLPLRGVDVGASDPTGGQQRLDLAQVYVNLDTKTQVPLSEEDKKKREQRALFEERETRPLGVLEAAIGNHHLVVLGDPGSGKSTFVSHLALCLAAHGLQPEAGWLERLPGWPPGEAEVVPIPVVLRDFARWLPAEVKKAEPCHLWDFIISRLQAQNLAFAAEPLHDALEKGKAVVLLDGLDEIPGKEQRTCVRDAVAVFAGRYPRSRVVVTCRTLSYQDPAWQLAGFPSFELAPFNKEKIDAFIGAWYDELARLGVVKVEEARGLAQRLREAVRRPDLWRLAPNPLLLTVMALVHTHKGRLPDARALLYEDTVDILLWRWEQFKAGEEEAPRLRQLLLKAGRSDVDLKRVLWRLAFEAHREGGAADEEALADIGELRLEKALAELHPEGSRDWAQRVVEVMKLRAGLLLERAPEVYTFPHRTFQEYLAGAHLAAQADFAGQAARLVEEGVFWREVVLLAVGRLVYLGGDVDKPLALVGELCPAQAADDEIAWRKVWLAGEALVEMGLNRVQDSALGRDLSGRVRHRLADLLRLGRLSPVERAAAGRALARLGDPRPGVGVIVEATHAAPLPDIVWCEVPAGPFLMGSADDDEMAYDYEKSQHTTNIPYGYLISRYPITNAQFGAFVEAGGYRERQYWVEAERAGVWKEGLVKGVLDDEPRAGPYDFGEPFNLANHPVVGITWYEALAFCRWLEEWLRVAGYRLRVWRDGELETRNLETLNLETLNLQPTTLTVRLPSEAEWEKAARGTDGRLFPWGNEPDPERANYGDTGIGTTSAVGCFPGGASPYGVEDLSGNVWEWTHSLWGGDWEKPDFKYPYNPKDGREDESAGSGVLRVLRGGAFLVVARLLRCAYRLRYNPGTGTGTSVFGWSLLPALPLAAGNSGLWGSGG
ncbi:MAG: SUMF1/EgtB/PvdO family nonheme iron enzyme, partial [Anaerolineae bacterium]|nr:SUMF1/EgtB/PvdO family nonheme iron enzyme [Anaerolineae bacterium]